MIRASAALTLLAILCVGASATLAQESTAVSTTYEREGDAPPAAPAQSAPHVEPQGGDDTQLTAAELAELNLSLEGNEVVADTAFHFYGFADFTYRVAIPPLDRAIVESPSTFSVGNFNLYMSKIIADQLRMFAEVRFLFLPNGTNQQLANLDTIDTTVSDQSELNRTIRWGGIQIQRVYLEYSFSALLTLRAGVFLTPYGIWNVDHGSPTVITVQRPFTIGFQLFPDTQTGIEAFGLVELGGHNSVGYHATISNGYGPVSEYKDLDQNKALGGRVYFRNDSVGDFRVGGSILYGRDTDARQLLGLDSSRSVTSTELISEQADVLALAADVQWSWGGFLVQGELVTQQRKYTEQGRVGASNPFTGAYLAPSDRLSIGAYGLLGYRFDWLGTMPYVLVQRFEGVEPLSRLGLNATEIMAGLNVRPLDQLVMKAEYRHVWFPGGFLLAHNPVRFLQLQVAWAF